MSKFAKVLKIAGAIVAVVLVGIGLGWLGSRGGKQTGSNSQPSVSTPDNPAPPAHTTPSSLLPKSGTTALPQARANPNAAPVPAVAPANLITNWDDKLDQILGSDGEDTAKAKELLEMFPRLPEEGQVEVAQHLSNLTPDENYAPLGQYLTNTALSEDVLDILMADLLNRPNSVKLPLLLEVARQEQNPKASDAKDILELFLEDNYGNDWSQWQAKMQQWLQENPD